MAKKYTRKGHKTRSAGRFGVRYGRKNRKLVADIEERMRQGYKCPRCGIIAIRRTDTGIWNCKKCDYTFAGGTYVPKTSVGLVAARSVKKAMESEIVFEEIEEITSGTIEAEETFPGVKNKVDAVPEVPTDVEAEVETDAQVDTVVDTEVETDTAQKDIVDDTL
ncbi:MAG: 50S ribosomal protein L37Ae [ANME-2 cluster archaeon]|nr:50S ribosomal protein L37Ae [ANME-2 cluster archaeon]